MLKYKTVDQIPDEIMERFWKLGTVHPKTLSPLEKAEFAYWDRNLPLLGPEGFEGGYKRFTRNRAEGLMTKSGLWLPFPHEVRACCQKLSGYNRYWNWSYKSHCSSILHCANLYDADQLELKRRVLPKRKTVNCAECGRLGVPTGDYLCRWHRTELDAIVAER